MSELELVDWGASLEGSITVGSVVAGAVEIGGAALPVSVVDPDVGTEDSAFSTPQTT